VCVCVRVFVRVCGSVCGLYMWMGACCVCGCVCGCVCDCVWVDVCAWEGVRRVFVGVCGVYVCVRVCGYVSMCGFVLGVWGCVVGV
jgi:hypothetical protein